MTSTQLALDPASQMPGISLIRSYDNRLRLTGETDTNAQLSQLYNYSVVYDGAGNVTGFNDSVMGTLSVVNDAEHRLQGVTSSAGYYSGGSLQYQYDSFGNRTAMTWAGNPQAPATGSETFNYNANNQLTSGATYDADGNVTDDGSSQYLYDAENRICAARSDFNQAITGYVYDGKGYRLGKGTLTSFSCDFKSNGFSATNIYLVGLHGEQLEETDGNLNALHFNVFLGNKLLATYAGSGYVQDNWHYSLNDWVGTRRVQAAADGVVEGSFQTLPFGDSLIATGTPGATEHEFTGKERDIESGNDYFGARYYSSNMGRFLSPDPSRLSIQPNNPQTWNRYAYVYNNPLRLEDDNGKWPTEIHNQIIDKAFPNLSASQRQILKNVSASQDSVLGGGQSNDSAYQHAMRSPDQTVAQAQAQYNDFVSGEETDAQNAQLKFWMADPDNKLDNLSPASLEAFGKALHAVLDSTSPAHAGFQKWNWMNPFAVYAHTNAEKTISSQQMQNAVNAARNAYDATYGYLIGDMDNTSVTTSQGPATPCGGNTGHPCQ